MHPLKKWLKHKATPAVAAFVIKYLLRILISTCKFHQQGLERLIEHAKKAPCILVLWHNRIVPIIDFMRRYDNLTGSSFFAIFVSKSRDGEILSRIIESFDRGKSIRVAHYARNEALREAIKELKRKKYILVYTPDGPRGPKYSMKPGIFLAAKESGADLFPLNWHCESYWELDSWDNLRIPKPFSTIHVDIGDPLTIADNHFSQNQLEEALKT